MVADVATKVRVEPEVKILDIDPDRAKAWLGKLHERQRSRRLARVAQYADDMRAGRWFLATQVIAFNTRNELVNGRHTLEAVVMSGATIRSIVLFNCPDAAMLVMDAGMKRSSDDQFRMAGKEYPAGCAATVRRALMGLSNFAGRSISDLRVDEFMTDHGDAVRFVHAALPRGPFAKASIRAVLTRAKIRRVAGERLERFAEVLTTGIMAAGENGAVLLRNAITEAGSRSAGSGTARRDLYALAETALCAFIERGPIRKLTAAREELFPIPGDKA